MIYSTVSLNVAHLFLGIQAYVLTSSLYWSSKLSFYSLIDSVSITGSVVFQEVLFMFALLNNNDNNTPGHILKVAVVVSVVQLLAIHLTWYCF